MSTIAPWRTVLIEGQTLLRNALAKAIRLDDRFELLAELEDGVEGKESCLRLNPDLVVMDICLPRTDGIELAGFLIKRLPETRVLALSHWSDPFTLNRLFEAGVHGYVAKDHPWEILEEAMIEVASGRNYFPAVLRQNQENLRSDPTAFAKILSVREQEILCYVASGWTSRSIASQLNLSPRSVETYRHRILRKLGVKNLAGLIDYAYRNGFVRPETSDDTPHRANHCDRSG
jgi:DNA-binding NarL/FixJ family response regulator